MVGHVEFKNINIYLTGKFITLLSLADWGTNYGANFINIKIDSDGKYISVNANNAGLLVRNALYTEPSTGEAAKYNFINCVNNVDFENQGTCTGVFIGSGLYFKSNAVVTFENCINNGNITGTEQVGLLYGNSTYNKTFKSNQVIVKNCKNNGTLLSFKDNATVGLCPNYKELNDKYQDVVGGLYVNDNYLKDKDIKVYQNGNSISINTTDETVTYKLAINVYSIKWAIGEQSNSVKFFMDLPVNSQETETTLNSFYAYDTQTAIENNIITAEDKLEYVSFGSWFDACFIIKDGKNYLILNTGENYTVDSNTSLLVYSYKNGRVNGVKEIK